MKAVRFHDTAGVPILERLARGVGEQRSALLDCLESMGESSHAFAHGARPVSGTRFCLGMYARHRGVLHEHESVGVVVWGAMSPFDAEHRVAWIRAWRAAGRPRRTVPPAVIRTQRFDTGIADIAAEGRTGSAILGHLRNVAVPGSETSEVLAANRVARQRGRTPLVLSKDPAHPAAHLYYRAVSTPAGLLGVVAIDVGLWGNEGRFAALATLGLDLGPLPGILQHLDAARLDWLNRAQRVGLCKVRPVPRTG